MNYNLLPTQETEKVLLRPRGFPPISSTQKSEMDQPLEMCEITDSIKLMQSGRAPGPDGYPIEFFKKIC